MATSTRGPMRGGPVTDGPARGRDVHTRTYVHPLACMFMLSQARDANSWNLRRALRGRENAHFQDRWRGALPAAAASSSQQRAQRAAVQRRMRAASVGRVSPATCTLARPMPQAGLQRPQPLVDTPEEVLGTARWGVKEARMCGWSLEDVVKATRAQVEATQRAP